MTSAAAAQATWLVDDSATGANNGGSWPNAFTSLDSALGAAAAGDFILVAHGTYRPSVPRDASDLRSSSFALVGGVSVIGGFKGLDAGPTGGSTAPGSPDGSVRLTMLRGENGTSTTTDDVYNVVHAPAFTSEGLQELERVVVRDGRADGTAPFVDYQRNGAGVYTSASGISGGGKLRLADVLFLDNYAEEAGGAVFYEGENTQGAFFAAVQCQVSSNEADERGGGFALSNLGADTTDADDGSYVMNCSFTLNEAGALATALDNAGGGAMWVGNVLKDANFESTNNCAVSNTVRGRGAAYAFVGSGSTRVANDTIRSNMVDETEGNETPCAVYVGTQYTPATAFFRNSVVWGNSGTVSPMNPSFAIGVLEEDGVLANADVDFNDIEIPTFGGPIPTYGGGSASNINQNPMFASPGTFSCELLSGSPCVDAGLNAAINLDLDDFDNDTNRFEDIPWDFRALSTFPRVTNSVVDMGAYEQ